MNKSYLAIAAALAASLIRKRPEEGVWYPITINSITPPLGSMGRKPSVWSQEQIALLGTVPDRVIAEKLGISVKTVHSKRRSLGIKPLGVRGPKTRVWSQEEIALLGTVPDRVIAEKLGLSISAVSNKRRSLGIESTGLRVTGFRPRVWSQEEIALLGTVPDKVIAEKLGISVKTVFRKRKSLGTESTGLVGRKPSVWSQEQIALLGTVPDRVIAEKLNLSIPTVNNKRRSLGIESTGLRGRRPRTWTEEQIALLGTVPDKVIAEKLGLSLAYVFKKRKKLGIKSKHGSKSQVEPIKLYKTNERHSSGNDVYRPVGEQPKSGKWGLSGKYYLFDGYNMYACDKPYKDDYGTFDGEPSYPIYNYVIM